MKDVSFCDSVYVGESFLRNGLSDLADSINQKHSPFAFSQELTLQPSLEQLEDNLSQESSTPLTYRSNTSDIRHSSNQIRSRASLSPSTREVWVSTPTVDSGCISALMPSDSFNIGDLQSSVIRYSVRSLNRSNRRVGPSRTHNEEFNTLETVSQSEIKFDPSLTKGAIKLIDDGLSNLSLLIQSASTVEDVHKIINSYYLLKNKYGGIARRSLLCRWIHRSTHFSSLCT